jgi:hypothetical protein
LWPTCPISNGEGIQPGTVPFCVDPNPSHICNQVSEIKIVKLIKFKH